MRRLDLALAGMPEVAADKEWHAFLLDWNMPQAGAPAGMPAAWEGAGWLAPAP